MLKSGKDFRRIDAHAVLRHGEVEMGGRADLAQGGIAHRADDLADAELLAHADGDVPSVVLHAPDFSEDSLGQLIYFFEKACAISGYVLGVNPFDQPGVEAYKTVPLAAARTWVPISAAMSRPSWVRQSIIVRS